MILLDGLKIAKVQLFEYQKQILNWKNLGYATPTLAIILIGDNLASAKFVDVKVKTCQKIGIKVLVFNFPENVYEHVVISKIEEINNNETIHGLIVQLPIPEHLSFKNVLSSISKDKDVDILNPCNFGLLSNDKLAPEFLPCTPSAVLKLFESYGINPKGKAVTIIGDGLITGRALANTLLNHFATVSVCNKFTPDISKFTKSADIVISCVGKRNLIQDYMVNKDAIVIDIGTSVFKDKVYGDVDFDAVAQNARMLTPVPGGVGPLTVISVISNLIKLYQKQEIEKKFIH